MESPLASSLGVPSLTLLVMGNPHVLNPSQFWEVEDPIALLASFYFNNTHQGIVKITPKKRKLDESSCHSKDPQVLVWNMIDSPPKQMAIEKILVMRAFSSASYYTIEEVIKDMENREVQIKEFQNQKMELETSLYQ